MPRFRGIHHLALATRDMDATIRFWRDLLGMKLVGGLGKPGYRQYFFEVSQNALLAFFEWPEVEPLPEKDPGYPVKGPFAFDHLSLEVESEKDLWTLKERLDAAGLWVTEAIDHGIVHSLYTFDPNGIPVELSWGTGEMDLHGTPRMMDAAPSAVTLEGCEPQPGKWPIARPTKDAQRKVHPGDGLDLVRGTKVNWWKRRL